MATVLINVHPVQDFFSALVWSIGAISGGISRKYLHAQICIISGDTKCCYDLRDKGVSTIELPNPSASYEFSVPPAQVQKMLERVDWYRERGFKVSLCSLWNAMIRPDLIHWNLCTSFVDFVFWGKVDTTSNRIKTFMTRYYAEQQNASTTH